MSSGSSVRSLFGHPTTKELIGQPKLQAINDPDQKMPHLVSGMGPLDHCKSGMPRLAEEEEQMLHANGSSSAPNSILVSNVGTLSTKPASPRVPAPQMPPAPVSLTPEQQKRRHIVASLVHSENSYVATLQRLVNVSLSFIIV